MPSVLPQSLDSDCLHRKAEAGMGASTDQRDSQEFGLAKRSRGFPKQCRPIGNVGGVAQCGLTLLKDLVESLGGSAQFPAGHSLYRLTLTVTRRTR
jgi:hypothetical protein